MAKTVYDAVGVRLDALPITTEKVYHKLQSREGENSMTQTITLRVNGKEHTIEVPVQRLLIDCLRYDLGLTGTKEGCSVGVCGACTILMNGQMISSCLTLAILADGAELRTVEGLAQEDGTLSPVQQAFIDHGGFQCGICTPGMVTAATALLESNPQPSEDDIKEWMMGNLCRCTGYYKIIASIQAAAAQLRGETVS
jgi:aerobic carbon-monoxide dehydrogenase small subunit